MSYLKVVKLTSERDEQW